MSYKLSRCNLCKLFMIPGFAFQPKTQNQKPGTAFISRPLVPTLEPTRVRSSHSEGVENMGKTVKTESVYPVRDRVSGS
jgi:hypothetical protein